MFPCVVESPIHGLVVIKRTPNPNNLTWGSVIVVRNGKTICFAENFSHAFEKINALIEANKVVLERKDRENYYTVSLHYGVKVHEHLPNYF